MEITEPKPKRYCKLTKSLPLPLILKKDGSIQKITGAFNGFSVIIEKVDDMKNIISMGYFGKANFSRSYPQFTKDWPEIIRERQFRNRDTVTRRLTTKTNFDQVIVVPDSDSENEEYFKHLCPKYEIDYSRLKENVWLNLEEAFFLANIVKCLNVTYKGEELTINKMWTLFNESQSNFKRNYIVYYYYRSKNWVVKPGIKFGGDFLLYKEGPPFYHATYVVIIDVENETGERLHSLTNRSMDNMSLLGLNRLCETAGKELLICKVIWPNSEINYECLTNVEIKEVLMRRWVYTERDEY